LHGRCGCIIGKDYPYPIVDHTAISKVNMGRMKVSVGTEWVGGGWTGHACRSYNQGSAGQVTPAYCARGVTCKPGKQQG